MIVSLLKKIRFFLRTILILIPNKFRLKNKKPSIIASNCNGGVIYHDLGLKFCSPTINLFFYPKDYLKFISNLRYYLSLELSPPKKQNKQWPIGFLDDVEIQFMHYKNFEDAKIKWEERSKRVNYDNLYFIWTDRDGVTYEQMSEFDNMQLKNKIVLTAKKYNEFSSAYQIKGFVKEKEVGILSNFKRYSYKRYLDDFDYVKFLNNKYL